MQDIMVRHRRLLRHGYSFEFYGKNDKRLNRRIARRRMKAKFGREQEFLSLSE